MSYLGVDPGPVGQIDPTADGQVFELECVGAEARLLATPEAAALRVVIRLKSISGVGSEVVVTTARGYGTEAAYTATFDAAGQTLDLLSITSDLVADGYRWTVLQNLPAGDVVAIAAVA